MPALIAQRSAGQHARRDREAYDLYLRGRFAYNQRTPTGLAEAAGSSAKPSRTIPPSPAVHRTGRRAREGRAGLTARRAIPSRASPSSLGRWGSSTARWPRRTGARGGSRCGTTTIGTPPSGTCVARSHSTRATSGCTTPGRVPLRRRTALRRASRSLARRGASDGSRVERENRDAHRATSLLGPGATTNRSPCWSMRSPSTRRGSGRTSCSAARYLAVGRYDDAIRALRRTGYEYAAFSPEAVLAYGLGVAGRTTGKRAKITDRLEARARGSYVRPVDLVAAHLGLGDTARALDWAERIPDDRGSMIFRVSPSRCTMRIRDTPRFRARHRAPQSG